MLVVFSTLMGCVCHEVDDEVHHQAGHHAEAVDVTEVHLAVQQQTRAPSARQKQNGPARSDSDDAADAAADEGEEEEVSDAGSGKGRRDEQCALHDLLGVDAELLEEGAVVVE